MEIIYKTSENKSNFKYCSEVFQGKKVLNGFNKLDEELMCESIADSSFNCQNIFFEKEIIADLYICYPLSVVVKAEVKFNSLHGLISEIRKIYNKIYYSEFRKNSKEKYGIWGHSIYDLVIESIKVVEGDEKPLIDVSIGS